MLVVFLILITWEKSFDLTGEPDNWLKVSIEPLAKVAWMPPACRGRLRVGCYHKGRKRSADATALRGGASRLVLFTLIIAASFSNKREPPPDKPVASPEYSSLVM